MIDMILFQYAVDAVLAGWIAYLHTRDPCARCKFTFTPKDDNAEEDPIVITKPDKAG